jgi:hypothetical protein
MAIGIPVSTSDINNIFGGTARDLDSTLTRVLQSASWLAAQPDAVLEAAPYNIASGDVAILRSAWADLVDIANLYQGTEGGANSHGGVAYDHRTFAKQLIGINAH